MNGYPSRENPYLFNGDFVDRGSWGLEVFITLIGWFLNDPLSMYMTRGNHETKSMNELYGFEGEVKHKGLKKNSKENSKKKTRKKINKKKLGKKLEKNSKKKLEKNSKKKNSKKQKKTRK